MARLRHFVVQGTAQAQSYISTSGGGDKPYRSPPRDESRQDYGERLAGEVRQAASAADHPAEKAAEGVTFLPIMVRSGPGVKLCLERLDNQTAEIINYRREDDGSERAVIRVPKDAVHKFAKKFEDFARKDDARSGKPKNQQLVESINEIRFAVLRDGAYWTDSGPLPPAEEQFWWEIWLRDEGEVWLPDGRALAVEDVFREEARQLGILVSDQQVRFPDTVVVLAFTTLQRLSEFPGLLRHLAEFRRASIVATEILDLTPASQAEFVRSMLDNTAFAGPDAPAVAILDRGVNRGHPLLEAALAEGHNLAWRDEWSPADGKGHGTQMAGLALYGPWLGELIAGDKALTLGHRLEAVKILPDFGRNDPPDYGPITVGSVAKIEVESPHRNRVLCMAVTAGDKEQWLPTLWSAAIDQMCAGTLDDVRRLMVVSAGNYEDELRTEAYPGINHAASVQDPAQAWNVLTVGAYTDKVMIRHPDFAGYNPVAPRGGLSPRSTTSRAWAKREWPLKPDIVMEGGNYALSPDGEVCEVEDLSLLTTHLSRDGGLFATMCDTSAATALAARYAAILQADYPHLWPETIRGLMVHSARWTKAMTDEFPHLQRQERLRCYGYGVPQLGAARQCAQNRATMIIQDALQPFCLDDNGRDARSNHMHLHRLPWPVEMLRDLGGQELRMRITLSYFIEPSPGRRGWNVKHRYQSHGLRFDVRRPEESVAIFRKRLTRDAWDDRKTRPKDLGKDTRRWVLGEDLRTKGSIHSDWWRGTAAELAASGSVAVYPITGWWRERPGRECYDKKARYSLIVSLESDDKTVPIYNAVAAAIENRTDISIVG